MRKCIPQCVRARLHGWAAKESVSVSLSDCNSEETSGLGAMIFAMNIEFGVSNPRRLAALESELAQSFNSENVNILKGQLSSFRLLLYRVTDIRGLELDYRTMYSIKL